MVLGFRNLERNGLLLPSNVLYFNVRCVFRDVLYHSRYFTHCCLSIRLHQPGHSVSPLSLIKHIPQPPHKMPLTSCYFVSALSSIESVVHENPRRSAVYICVHIYIFLLASLCAYNKPHLFSLADSPFSLGSAEPVAPWFPMAVLTAFLPL